MRATRADYRQGARDAYGLRGLIRRLRVAATAGVRWALEGFDDGDSVEQIDAEVFGSAGLVARPTERAEAIVARVGGAAGHPVVLATRDQSWAGGLPALEDGETVLHNGTAVVRIKPDGTIEIGTIGGVVEPLVRRSEFNAHVHTLSAVPVLNATPAGPGPVVATGAADAPAPITGTAKVRGE